MSLICDWCHSQLTNPRVCHVTADCRNTELWWPTFIPNTVKMDQTAQTLKLGTQTYVSISINKKYANVANSEKLLHRKFGILNSITRIKQNVRHQIRARQYSPLRKTLSFYCHVGLLPPEYHSNNTNLFFKWRGKSHNKTTDKVSLICPIKTSAVILILTMGMENFNIAVLTSRSRKKVTQQIIQITCRSILGCACDNTWVSWLRAHKEIWAAKRPKCCPLVLVTAFTVTWNNYELKITAFGLNTVPLHIRNSRLEQILFAATACVLKSEVYYETESDIKLLCNSIGLWRCMT